MAGANLFGIINAVLTCVVLGIVATRGGDVKKTTNNNAAAETDPYMPSFLTGARGFGSNPCIDPAIDKAPLRNDLGDIDCEDASTGAQSATDVTKGAAGDRDPGLAPIVDYNDAGMCTVNVHWHIGAEHRSEGQYDEAAAFDHPNKDTYAGSHRRLASSDGGMRIGHMCTKGKELWEANDASVRNSDGSVNEYDWKYCKDMHVGLTYEFHWPHSSLGACQTPWQYQYHFLDGVLCGATQLGIDINTAAAALTSKAHAIGVEGQVFTIVNGATDAAGGAAAIRPTWDVLNGWDRQSAKDVAYYQGSTTGDAVQSGAHAGDKCRGTWTASATRSRRRRWTRCAAACSSSPPTTCPPTSSRTAPARRSSRRSRTPRRTTRTTRAPAASAAPTRRRRRPRPTDTSHKARLPAETAPHPTPPHRWCRHAEATADVSTALDRLLAR